MIKYFRVYHFFESDKFNDGDKIMLVKSTTVPPRGWNSYDSYGVYINEEQALANIEAFAFHSEPS